MSSPTAHAESGSATIRRRSGGALRRRPAGLLVLVGALACVYLAVAGPSADAASLHEFKASYGAASSTPPNPYPLSGPSGVAVDQGGDIYVADTQNFRVEEFDPGGHFILAFGKGVNQTTHGNVCTLASGNTCGVGTQGVEGAGEFSRPVYVAVDDSAGPSAGDVYVGDGTTNAVYKFDGSGNFISSEEGLFGPLDGIAVDSGGNLWVYDKNGNMFEFDASGTQLQTWPSPFGTGEGLDGLALDESDHPYVVRGFPWVEKLSETGGDLGTVLEDQNFPTGLAVNPVTDDLYVDDGTEVQRVGLGPACVPASQRCAVLETFGASHLSSGAGVAVDLSDNAVYAADLATGTFARFAAVIEATTGTAEEVATTSVTLTGTVNADGTAIEECRFEYGPTVGYGHSVPCVETVGAGSGAVSVHARASGLPGGVPVHYRLVAKNARGIVQGDDASVETLPIPVLEDLTISNQTASSVDLDAVINPRGLETSFHFELGTSASYGQSFPTGHLPAGEVGVSVSQHLTGLVPDTTYHWRLVATDANGTSESTDFTFVYDTTGPSLPDHRAYEMVTPVNKNGALIGDEVLGLAPSVKENGERLIIDSIQGFAGTESSTGSRQNEGEPYSFTRTASGWVTEPMAPSAPIFGVNTIWNVSADSGDSLFSIPAAPGGQDSLFAREGDGSFSEIGPASSPEAGPMGPDPFASASIDGTRNFSHVDFELGNSYFSGDETTEHAASLYQYEGRGNSRPDLVGVTGPKGSTSLIGKCGVVRGGTGTILTEFYNSMSEDGRRIYFTALGPCPEGSGENSGPGHSLEASELFVRKDNSETIPISGRSTGECGVACRASTTRDAQFEGASADGAQAFFTSTQKLTDAASEDSNGLDTASSATGGCRLTVSANGCNLYEYDFDEPSAGRMIDVSAGDTSGGGPQVQGVVAVSGDGSHVYFVAKGVLTGAANDEGDQALAGVDNLYVYERDARFPVGHTSFIRVVPHSDEELLWRFGVGNADVTPDGRYLVFTSHGILTRDDKGTGQYLQAFSYDAATGTLTRISKGENGFNDNGNGGVGDARIVEARLFDVGSGPVRGDPTMSDDGSYIFFQSPVALTPQALNDVVVNSLGDMAQNIYEYHEGHVYLLSDGRDVSAGAEFLGGEASGRSSVRLLASDTTGDNVFFTTADRLDPSRDTDTQIDYYDARVCTAASPCIGPAPASQPPCGSEVECHGPPTPAPAATPLPSIAFMGSGNLPAPDVRSKKHGKRAARRQAKALKACRRKRSGQKRQACEKAVKHRYQGRSSGSSVQTRRKGR